MLEQVEEEEDQAVNRRLHRDMGLHVSAGLVPQVLRPVKVQVLLVVPRQEHLLRNLRAIHHLLALRAAQEARVLKAFADNQPHSPEQVHSVAVAVRPARPFPVQRERTDPCSRQLPVL